MPATVYSEHTLTLFSVDSCTFTVPANTATDIEDKFIADAVTKGLAFHSSNEAPADRPKMPVDQAIIQVVAEGNPKNFNGITNLPKVGIISDLVGEKVSARQIQEVWETLGISEPEQKPEVE